MPIDYTKLARDIKTACDAAIAADPIEDGGTCNLDSIFLRLPRANEAMVEAAAKTVGASAWKSDWLGRKGFFISVPAKGQANRHATMVEAGFKKLRELGWDVGHYQQMD